MSIEHIPGSIEAREKPPTIEEHLDALNQDAGRHDLAVVAEDLRAQKYIQESVSPEKQLAASTAVRESSKSATEKLRKLKLAAALATALLAMEPQESRAQNQESITAEALVENPGRLEELLEGVLVSIEEKENQPELTPLKEQTNHVLVRMQDEHKKDGKYGKVALQVGETALKVLVSAAGFGLGVTAYEGMKKIVQTMRGATT